MDQAGPTGERNELERLVQQPERWPALEVQRLLDLTQHLALRYGATRDFDLIAPLQRLYGLLVERAPASQRLALLERIYGVAGRQSGWEGAFYPFIVAESDHAVISTASLYLALLTPLEDDDPLTGPRRLRSLAEKAADEQTRASILSGLLLLGDRRTLPLLEGAWELLGPRGSTRLAGAHSGVLYASVVEFLLGWLERAEGQTFGLVAAALARLPAGTGQGRVLDVERRLPAGPTGGPALRVLREWTLEEFGRELEPRLRELARREQEPRLLPHVLAAWGLSAAPAPPPEPPAQRPPAPAPSGGFEHVLGGLAERRPARPTALGGPLAPEELADRLRGQPGSPLLLAAPPEATRAETLLAWGWSGQPGPLRARIDRVLVPATGEWLLLYVGERPTSTRTTAFDLLSAEAARYDRPVLEGLERYFETNGALGAWILTSTLPTYVQLVPRSPVGRPAAGFLFQAAHEALARSGLDPAELEADDLLAERSPWSRFGGAVRRALRRPRRPAPPAAPSDDSAQSDLPLSAWLALASHPDWVQRAERELAEAWEEVESRRR